MRLRMEKAISLNYTGVAHGRIQPRSFRPTGINPHLECRSVPGGCSTRDVGFQLSFETSDERIADDQATLGQKDHVADVALNAALQFCQCKVVRFESPEANLGPGR